ncbi:MAG: RNA methyltransferase [Ferruginibacter sp.]|nr:RNA methyltransferase [Ferruginibacter sp.]
MTPERTERINDVLAKRQTGLTVVLENVSDPHNISAVMRTCDAVGIQDIYILNTKIGAHEVWSAKASSSAMNWLTVHQFSNLEACFLALRKNFEKIYTTHLSTDAVGLYELNLTEKVALVFGNEHDGCSDEIIALADGNFIIPQVGMIKSLNISVACAVSVYEAYRQKNNAGHYKKIQLDNETVNGLMKKWDVPKFEKRAVAKEQRKIRHEAQKLNAKKS